MINSYFMAGFNVLAFITFFSVFLLLHKKYPKLHIYSAPLILLFSLLPLVSLLRIGTYESGDLSFNVYKTMELFKSLQEGNIIPTWAGNLNAMYGYPLFIFTYPLPYFLNVFFHILGFSFVSSVKLTLAFSYIFSGIFMYYFLREKVSEKAAFFGAILYLYAPYHLVNMHFRVDIGEMCAITFVPLIFLSLEKIAKQKTSAVWISIGSISIACLILSHQAVSLTALPFTIIYLFSANTVADLKKVWYRYIAVYVLGLLLCGFYVFPLLVLKEFTIQSLGVSMSFATLTDLLYSPYRYGLLFQGPNGELSFLLGYTQLVLLVTGIYMYKTTKLLGIHKRLLSFALLGIGLMIFFLLKISEPLWFTIPLIKNFQFSYRILSVTIFFFAVVGAVVTEYLKKPLWFYLLFFLTIITTILNWGNRRVIPAILDKQLARDIPISTYYGEGLSPAAPKWVDPKNVWMKDPPKQPLEVLSGKARITVGMRKTNEHHYNIIVEEPSEFKENTLYFPDWTIKANNKIQDVQYTNSHFPGIMTFRLPKGTYRIDVIYNNPQVTKISQIISVVTFFSLFLFTIVSYRDFLLAPLHKKR